MVPRVYVPGLEGDSREFGIPPGEAVHLTRVLRIKAGAPITVFDGRGHQFSARLEAVRGPRVTARIVGASDPAPEAAVHVTLAQALLKGQKMDEVVRDAVMLGVTGIQPIVTARAEVERGKRVVGRRVERWERVALASVKQCGRAVMPVVHAPVSFARFMTGESDMREMRLLLVEPLARTGKVEPVGSLGNLARPERAVVMIGPEGGWSNEELTEASRRGTRLISMGGRTLRADAMAISALSVLMFLWGSL
jgi:16S rRNA (uracil1498-N3)-methyltransferase